jgi:hypothetical protein
MIDRMRSLYVGFWRRCQRDTVRLLQALGWTANECIPFLIPVCVCARARVRARLRKVQ